MWAAGVPRARVTILASPRNACPSLTPLTPSSFLVAEALILLPRAGAVPLSRESPRGGWQAFRVEA